MKKYIIGIIVLATIFVVGCSNSSNLDDNEVTTSAIDRIYNLDPQRKLIGGEIDDYHLINILTDKQVHLGELYKNKVVMIQSFSIGCPACVRGIKDYNELYGKYNIEVIYMDINPDDTLEDIKEVKDEFNGKDWIWANYQGSLLPFYETYNFKANDMTFIIDKDGKIAYADSFSVPLERLENELKKLGTEI